jgi:hypothetical protein
MNWIEYTEAAQRLAEARRGEARRQTGVQERTAGMRATADTLKRRLDAQRGRLLQLAERLRLPAPVLAEVPRGGVTDPEEAARLSWEAIAKADEAANEAERRGHEPFLAGVPTAVRNATIYAATTLVCALVAGGMVLFGARTPDRQFPVWTMPWALCGLPAVAFFAGYFIIVNFTRPRIAPGQRVAKGERSASVRLGGLICVIGTWLAWAVAVTANLG